MARTGIEEAARVVGTAQHVALITGFTVAKGMPETDGPPGTVLLYHDLQKAGIKATIITDKTNAPVVRKCLRAIGLTAQDVVVFDAPHNFGKARIAAKALLDRLKPDTMVSIERPGRNAQGEYLNMRGVSVKGFNPPLDILFELFDNRPNGRAIAIGDGGNEIGMGNVNNHMPSDVLNLNNPRADMPAIYTKVLSDYPITASVSNWGAELLGGAVLRNANKLHLWHSVDQQTAAIMAAGRAGAVDGVMRLPPGEVEADTGLAAGVDGFNPKAHRGWYRLAKQALAQPPVTPIELGLFDSSNGGIVAAKTLGNEMSDLTSGSPVRQVLFLDHDNAPYGELTPRMVAKHTHSAFKSMDELNLHGLGIVCNTASASGENVYAAGVSTPVTDLVIPTANAIVAHGDPHPVLIATQGTVDVGAYPVAIAEAADQAGVTAPTVHMLAAPTWAPAVNQMEHVSPNPEISAGLDEKVRAVVDQVPPNATSVWCNCTHYPVLADRIRAALAARGMGDVPVIDPMVDHAKVITASLDLQATGPTVGPEYNQTMVVTTSDDPFAVWQAAKKILGDNSVVMAQVKKFGGKLDESYVVPMFRAPRNISASEALTHTLALKELQRSISDVELRRFYNTMLGMIDDAAPPEGGAPTAPTQGPLPPTPGAPGGVETASLLQPLASSGPNQSAGSGAASAMPLWYVGAKRVLLSTSWLTDPNAASVVPATETTAANATNATQGGGQQIETLSESEASSVSPPAQPGGVKGFFSRVGHSKLPWYLGTLSVSAPASFLIDPHELALGNGTGFVMRGLGTAAPLIVPKISGRLVNGWNMVSLFLNGAYHNYATWSFDPSHWNWKSQPHNSGYALTDEMSGTQRAYELVKGRAFPASKTEKYVTQVTATVANSFLMADYSIQAGPQFWLPTVSFGGGVLYGLGKMALTDLRSSIAARRAVAPEVVAQSPSEEANVEEAAVSTGEAPVVKAAPKMPLDNKIATWASAVGLTSFGASYLVSTLTQAAPAKKKPNPAASSQPSPTTSPTTPSGGSTTPPPGEHTHPHPHPKQPPQPQTVVVAPYHPGNEATSTLDGIAKEHLGTLLTDKEKTDGQRRHLSNDTLVADFALEELINLNPQYNLAANPDLLLPGWQLVVTRSDG
ncbi:MAG: LWXIA domain-containing protein [Burkholderiales bacterium]|nr:LWXIA domain-containing protein [Burkholderiales bacterium]